MGKKKKIILAITALIILITAGVFYSARTGGKPEYTTAKAERGVLKQTVSATGAVKSISEVDLNFKTAGKIGEIKANVGQAVKAGDELASLDLKDLQANVTQAEADLTMAQANYNKLTAGATSEDLAVTQAEVNKAEVAYNNDLRDLDNAQKTAAADIKRYKKALEDAQVNLQNVKDGKQSLIDQAKDTAITVMDNKIPAAEGALDVVEKTLKNNDAQTTLSILNTKFLNEAWDNYEDSLDALGILPAPVNAAKADKESGKIKTALDEVLGALDLILDTLNDVFDALLATVATSTFTEEELAAAKTNIRAEITNVSGAISTVQGAQQGLVTAELNYETAVSSAQTELNTAETTLAQTQAAADSKVASAKAAVDTGKAAWDYAKAQLAFKKAPARSEDIRLQFAKVKQAQAALQLAQNQLLDSILTAPIDGIITAKNYEVGEQVSLTTPVLTLLGSGGYEIEVDISEADIAKVSVGQETAITLDAFGEGKPLAGEVMEVDPAETIIQDVVYYKIKVRFKNDANGIKSGMSADVDIMTNTKENVLLVPQRAVNYKNGGTKYVKVLIGEKVEEREVETGLYGDGGLVEIVSGLKEGEEVVTFSRD